MANIKITCTRCNGSGRFSFNLRRGTVCFGCDGVGFQIVDEAKHAKAQAKRAAAKAKRDSEMGLRLQLAKEIGAEMNAKYGPFADNERGAYDLWAACMQNEGKSVGEMVQAKLDALQVIA